VGKSLKKREGRRGIHRRLLCLKKGKGKKGPSKKKFKPLRKRELGFLPNMEGDGAGQKDRRLGARKRQGKAAPKIDHRLQLAEVV